MQSMIYQLTETPLAVLGMLLPEGRSTPSVFPTHALAQGSSTSLSNLVASIRVPESGARNKG